MHFHVPKPLHGWREFAGEVGVIVLGVLIALGAEQLVEQIHWSNEVASARRALAAEIAHNNRFFAFRAAVQPCLERRLTSLQMLAERAAKRQPMLITGDVMPDTGYNLRDNVWESYRASQTLTHFDNDTLALLSNYYQQVGYSRLGMTQEGESQSVLRVLRGDTSRLGPTDIGAIRIAAERARSVGTVLGSIAREELETSKQLKIAVPAPDRSRVQLMCAHVPDRSAQPLRGDSN